MIGAGALDNLERCLVEVLEAGVPGDVCETGVWRGGACIFMRAALRVYGQQERQVWLADSFEGLPEVEGVDSTKHNEFYKGQYACSKDQVIANLESKGVDWDRTFLIEGYYDKSLTPELYEEYGMRSIAVALIDCDLYSSTCEVLQFIRPLIVNGSILMFDDWSCFNSDNTKGQRRAFLEFLDAHSEVKAEDLFSYGKGGQKGQVFLVRAIPQGSED